MNRIIFTEETKRLLHSEYNRKTNRMLAKELGICEQTLVKYAKRLGLVKWRPVRMRDVIAHVVCFMFPYSSYQEMAMAVGMSVRTVARIVIDRQLKRTEQEEWNIRSRIRKELIKKERRHILFGLPQRTKIKVVSNRKRLNLKSKLRSFGYVEHPSANIFFYHENMKRHPIREQNGEILGLKFYHLSEFFDHLIDKTA